MNWTEPRKSHKFSEQALSAKKKIQTTCLNTPIFDKQYKSSKQQLASSVLSPKINKNCPYHFNYQDHVCLTCRKSVCLRCAITYCHNHIIKSQKQIIPILVQDLQKIHIKQKMQQIQTKLLQSQQRQQYLQKKMQDLLQKIQDNFNSVIQVLNRKKIQIIGYYDQELQKNLKEFQQYNETLKNKLNLLISINNQCFSYLRNQSDSNKLNLFNIQKIDQLVLLAKDDKQSLKIQKKINSSLLYIHKTLLQDIWTEQKLQKLLFQIENIQFKMGKQKITQSTKITQKKKRVVTQSSQNPTKMYNSTHKSPPIKNIKDSGRVILNKFHSGRKSKEERFQKSQLI